MTPSLPTSPRTITFIDGQNLFYAAKEAFGYSYPNYDPLWHHFWSAKLAQMGRLGVTIFSRPLRYRNQTVNLPDGTKHTILVGQEKGIDVRVALDIVRLANEDSYDVCLILSQDQDLTEAVDEVKLAARKQNRWIKVACAFPTSPTFRNNRGIDKTAWIPKH